ncbi:uncharacterized protein LOC143766097 isoform X1 [Ranitomeya variabilis]|uniref:uncharacterized protein LOC143766097 isoform X1 n=1 Tax=Ranitomeya variabilis TaxID=490064 RepID=UPI004057182C
MSLHLADFDGSIMHVSVSVLRASRDYNYEINQKPDKINNVPLRSQVKFTCTTQGTCDVDFISIEISKNLPALMKRNSTKYFIENPDITFKGTLTDYTIEMKVNKSNDYYCVAIAQRDGISTRFQSKGTQIIVANAAVMTASMLLLFLSLLSLVCIHVGI